MYYVKIKTTLKICLNCLLPSLKQKEIIRTDFVDLYNTTGSDRFSATPIIVKVSFHPEK